MIGNTSSSVLLSAAAGTLFVVLIDVVGGFHGWNERLLDLEQQHLPRDAQPMSSEIVMADIDDRALERLGRWPWPRADLAGAINELRRAGARTIAVDLDLADPQHPTWHPGPPQSQTNHDQLLADAIDKDTILGVLLMPDELEARWAAAGGSPGVLAKTLERMREDLSLDPRADGPDATTDTLHLLRRRAIFDLAATVSDQQSLFELAGDEQGAMEPLIDTALRQRQGRISLPGGIQGGPSQQPSPSDRFPLPEFGNSAGGSGYVNIVRRSSDGGVRHLLPSQPIGRGALVPPLGIAAVQRFLGAETPYVIEDDAVIVGDVRLPLTGDAITLCWPRSIHGMDWPNLHRSLEDDDRFTGHISIGEVVLLARARQMLERATTLKAEASRDLIRGIRMDSALENENWLSNDLQLEIADEVDFTLGNIRSRDALATELVQLDEAEHNLLTRMLDWRLAAEAATAASERIAQVEQSLQNAVQDRLVFVGWTATGTVADFIPTAAGPRTPGVMVHAALADMVLQERSLHEGSRWWSPVASAVLGLCIAIIVASLGPWPATAASLGLLVLWIITLIAMFSYESVVLPAATPLVAMTLSWATGTGSRAILVQQEKRRITRQFRARVPEALVDELARDPNALSMLGVRREVCVMFGDLAGFTQISERLGTEQTVALLNRCMAGLTDRVTSRDAYLNKFLGDGFLAFWSAFGPQSDQATLACHAAMECQEFMALINADPELNQPQLGLRIGIATGEALVGDCGAPPRLNDYTVIGDVANLAARLESANKQLGTSILLDGRTHELVDDTDLPFIEVGPIQVVGRNAIIDSWTLSSTPPSVGTVDQHAALAMAIRDGDRSAAQAALEAVEATDGTTSISRRFAEVIRDTPDPMPRALRLQEK